MLAKTVSPATRKATIIRILAAAVLLAASHAQTPPSQNKPETPASAAALEFPVVFQQNVIAGKTPVGTKVQAKLAVATLLHGVVIPQDAVITGEVIESTAKSATDPSRLAVRMETVQWKNEQGKNGAAPAALTLTPNLYLTAWYYPAASLSNPDSGFPDAAQNPKVWNGSGISAGQRSAGSPPPLGGSDQDPRNIPDPTAPGTGISQRRVLMKNVESTSNTEAGVGVVLTSKHSNIKLDKTTTYVLAPTDLLPSK